MPMSQYVDSFFFVSLGITFVLLFLMAFHFKNRIASIEKKNSTLTDICTTMVSEIGKLKSTIQGIHDDGGGGRDVVHVPPKIDSLYYTTTTTTTTSSDSAEEEEEEHSNRDSETEEDLDDGEMEETIIQLGDDAEVSEIIVQKNHSMDFDEVQPNEINRMRENDESIFVMNAQSDDILAGELESFIASVQHGGINMSMGNSSRMVFMESSFTHNNSQEDDTNGRVEEITEEHPEIVEEDRTVQIVKVEGDVDIDIDMNDVATEVPVQEPSSEMTNTVNTVNEDYKKMTVHMLRTAAIRDGLCSDPSKMKKQELLKLFAQVE